MMTTEQIAALTGLIQALAVMFAAGASLYAALRGRANGAKLDTLQGHVQTVQAQTDGLSSALVTATGNAAFAAGLSGSANPTPPIDPALARPPAGPGPGQA